MAASLVAGTAAVIVARKRRAIVGGRRTDWLDADAPLNPGSTDHRPPDQTPTVAGESR
ncbi:MAG: hypothetical protein QM831_31245 [Kofleriaceae bacterium]